MQLYCSSTRCNYLFILSAPSAGEQPGGGVILHSHPLMLTSLDLVIAPCGRIACDCLGSRSCNDFNQLLSEATNGMIGTASSPPCVAASLVADIDDEQVPAEIREQGIKTDETQYLTLSPGTNLYMCIFISVYTYVYMYICYIHK